MKAKWLVAGFICVQLLVGLWFLRLHPPGGFPVRQSLAEAEDAAASRRELEERLAQLERQKEELKNQLDAAARSAVPESVATPELLVRLLEAAARSGVDLTGVHFSPGFDAQLGRAFVRSRALVLAPNTPAFLAFVEAVRSAAGHPVSVEVSKLEVFAEPRAKEAVFSFFGRKVVAP